MLKHPRQHPAMTKIKCKFDGELTKTLQNLAVVHMLLGASCANVPSLKKADGLFHITSSFIHACLINFSH